MRRRVSSGRGYPRPWYGLTQGNSVPPLMNFSYLHPIKVVFLARKAMVRDKFDVDDDCVGDVDVDDF